MAKGLMLRISGLIWVMSSCKDSDDKFDILNRRGSFIGQANNVVCWFGKLDCRVKTNC